uniref:Uncharacterized protein n=1 Tax=Anguilla anguilla TaxID=7936 RepID=A0A0E9PIX3_ANGAN
MLSISTVSVNSAEKLPHFPLTNTKFEMIICQIII